MADTTSTEAARLVPLSALDRRHRHRWALDDGRVITADLIVCAEEDWPGHPESRDPEWSAVFEGGLCLAVQLPAGI